MRFILLIYVLLFGNILCSNELPCGACNTNDVVNITNEKTSKQCIAITRSGKQCKRKSVTNSFFCKQHQKISEKKQKTNEHMKTILDEKKQK